VRKYDGRASRLACQLRAHILERNGNDLMIRNFINASRIFLRTLWRVSRQLFHEAAGAAFAMFAIYGVMAAWRGYHARQRPWILALPICYGAMMAFFSMMAFRSSRRVR
jgi:hypothetical protein